MKWNIWVILLISAITLTGCEETPATIILQSNSNSSSVVTNNITVTNNVTTTANVTAVMTINDSTRYDEVRNNNQANNSFNGSQFLRVSTFDLNLSLSYFSVSVWAIRNSPTTGGLIQLQNTSLDRRIRLFTSGTGAIEFDVNPGELGNPSNATYAIVGRLVHAVGTYNGTHMLLYLNGSLVSVGSPVSLPLANQSFNRLQIGDLGGSNFFNGTIYSVEIYNKTLSTSEITDLSGLGPNAPSNISNGLVAQYLLNRTEALYSNSTHVFDVAYLPTGEYYHRLFDSSGTQLRTVVWS